MAHSLHHRFKRCTLCKPRQRRGHGKARKAPFNALRRLGRKRRLTSRVEVD